MKHRQSEQRMLLKCIHVRGVDGLELRVLPKKKSHCVQRVHATSTNLELKSGDPQTGLDAY